VVTGVLIGLGVVFGALIGRWWSIALAVPAGLIGSSRYSWEGFSDTEVAVAIGSTVAIGLVIGIGIRKYLDRVRSNGTGPRAK
jgi:hypothetical protein